MNREMYFDTYLKNKEIFKTVQITVELINKSYSEIMAKSYRAKANTRIKFIRKSVRIYVREVNHKKYVHTQIIDGKMQ